MKKLIPLILLVAIVLAVFAAGCQSPVEHQNSDSPGTQLMPGQSVTRYTDNDAGVVCWIYDYFGKSSGGIACMPIKDTLLAR